MTDLTLSEQIAAAKADREAAASAKKSETLKVAEDSVRALLIDIGVVLDDANSKINTATSSKEDGDKIAAKLNAIKAELSTAVEEILTSDKIKGNPGPAAGAKTSTTTPPTAKTPAKKAASSDATDKAGNTTEDGTAESDDDGLWGRLKGVVKNAN